MKVAVQEASTLHGIMNSKQIFPITLSKRLANMAIDGLVLEQNSPNKFDRGDASLALVVIESSRCAIEVHTDSITCAIAQRHYVVGEIDEIATTECDIVRLHGGSCSSRCLEELCELLLSRHCNTNVTTVLEREEDADLGELHSSCVRGG